jgi:hypothetical protein
LSDELQASDRFLGKFLIDEVRDETKIDGDVRKLMENLPIQMDSYDRDGNRDGLCL